MTLGAKPVFRTLHLRTFLSLILSSHKHLPLVLALFQMADDGWIGGICFAEPGLPKLLILSLERRRHEEGLLYQVATYLASLDQLFDEQANLLREQTHRAEQAELAVRLQ